jgi:hypothetical protein
VDLVKCGFDEFPHKLPSPTVNRDSTCMAPGLWPCLLHSRIIQPARVAIVVNSECIPRFPSRGGVRSESKTQPEKCWTENAYSGDKRKASWSIDRAINCNTLGSAHHGALELCSYTSRQLTSSTYFDISATPFIFHASLFLNAIY